MTGKLLALLVALPALAQPQSAPSYTVETFAGAGDGLGDGGPASRALLRYPRYLAFDAKGNLYISDTGNARIRRVDTRGNIATVVGNGTLGDGGDGGPATQAQISSDIAGMAVTSDGTLYFSDRGNGRVRRLTAAGILESVVSGRNIRPGHLAAGPAGSLYIADTNENRVLLLDHDGVLSVAAGPGAPSKASGYFTPGGLCVDSSGTLYIGNRDRIESLPPGGSMSAVADSVQAGVPSSIAVDKAGNLYVLSRPARRIHKVSTHGTVTAVAGAENPGETFGGDGGPAAEALLASPFDLAFSPSGELYISDYDFAVRAISSDGKIRTVIGRPHFGGDGGPAVSALFTRPYGLALDAAGNVYIADMENLRVRKVDSHGAISTVAGTGERPVNDRETETSNKMGRTIALALDSPGNLYISTNNRIRRLSPDGTWSVVAGTGKKAFGGDGGPGTAAGLDDPMGLAVDSAGNVYISDTRHDRIRKVTSDGVISTIAGNGKHGFGGDKGPATAAQLNSPRNIALDRAGNLYIADNGNHRIRKVTPDGTITTFAGSRVTGSGGDEGPAIEAQLQSPWGVAADAAGNVYITQSDTTVRMVTPDGVIHTIGGTGGLDSYEGLGGDGGPARAARFWGLRSIAADSRGNLYVVEQYNERVRVLKRR